MRALLIQHDAQSPTGPVGERLVHHGYTLSELLVVPPERQRDPSVEGVFPDPGAADLIVAMGAPWSVDDVALIGPWITPELAFLAGAHAAGVPVLGICFGGQALATALGGGVERAPRPELGWTRVETDEPSLVGPGPWFQFHFDRWILPPGVREIARNEACSQAFVSGRSMGVQFHPEITLAELDLWLAHGGEAPLRGAGRDPEAVRAEVRRGEPASVRRTHALIDAYLSRVASAEATPPTVR
ncbi:MULTISPECIES: type 1 glutamine amidotransferase [Thermomonosporaceae]|uniref:type 1 glutamine amidotransferase n=1 Tax=Thermomonosporaceae TaxID=2012 RepID=UPI00255B1422|nr:MULTISPECIES: type 1 glutamine amidotransferase [Thermomonosporaceae]MDL4777548.1 type 1 glutamine amidotransferase [Actinomadura xylanilytica]